MIPYMFTYKQIADIYMVNVLGVVDKFLDAKALPTARDPFGEHLFAVTTVLTAMGYHENMACYLR